jgi:hypothetical protein
MSNSDGPLNSPKPTTSVIVGGVYNAATPTPEDGQALALQQDAQGRLLVSSTGGGGGGNVIITGINSVPPALTNPLPVELSDGTNAFGTAGNPLSVNVITGGGSNASVGSNGAGAPTSSTQVGGSDGVDLQPLQVDASKNLKTVINAALPAGTNVIGHVIADSGSTTAVTGNVTVVQGTGTNLHAVIDSGSTTAVTGNVTVVQGTGTNLHTVIDSGTLTTVSTVTAVTAITNALPAGSNVIGHVITDSGSTTAVTGSVAVIGTLTNNNAAPAATNVGALIAIANAAAPSLTEGDQVLQSVDLSGHQRVVATGQVASGSAVAGNPVLIGGFDGVNVRTIATDSGGGVVLATANIGALADGISNTPGTFTSVPGTRTFMLCDNYLFNGSTWDRARDAGIGNAVAATGIAASVAYVQYNTTLPAPTAGQYTAAQCDTTGSTYINMEGRKATYSAFASFTAVAGDIAVLPGSASKTIRVTRVEVSFVTTGTAAIETVQLVKRSAADTGGTSAAMTAVPHDSNFAGASAAPLNYTVAPTPGAAVGTIRGVQFNDASSALPGGNSWIWDFGTRPSAAIVLRGVAQMLCVSLPTAVATQTAQVSFEWSEE